MKRVLGLVVVAVLVTACSSSDASDEAVPVEDLAGRAGEVTDQLAENDWEAVRADFDDDMTEKLTGDLLVTAWEQVTASKGAYESRGEPEQIPKPGDFIVFDTPMTFSEGQMKSRVTFHEDGRIAGLFILEPDALQPLRGASLVGGLVSQDRPTAGARDFQFGVTAMLGNRQSVRCCAALGFVDVRA